jgi:hypothetical protein
MPNTKDAETAEPVAVEKPEDFFKVFFEWFDFYLERMPVLSPSDKERLAALTAKRRALGY